MSHSLTRGTTLGGMTTKTRAPQYKVKRTHSTSTMKKLLKDGWSLESDTVEHLMLFTIRHTYVLKKEK